MQQKNRFIFLEPPIPQEAETRQQAIRIFLQEFSPPLPSPTEADSLTLPLTPDKWTLALSQMKAGKSLGPDGHTVQYYKMFGNSWTPFFVRFQRITGDPCSPLVPPGSTHSGVAQAWQRRFISYKLSPNIPAQR